MVGGGTNQALPLEKEGGGKGFGEAEEGAHNVFV